MENYDKLVKDLENLKNVERPRVLQELVDARAQGDLSENAEYHAAKERLAAIDNIEMPKLQDQLARAQVIAFDANSDTIKFGATITAKNLKTKRRSRNAQGQEPVRNHRFQVIHVRNAHRQRPVQQGQANR